MRNFFNFNLQRIINKSEHIDKIMPAYIKNIHNDLILKFKSKGKSKFLGKNN